MGLHSDAAAPRIESRPFAAMAPSTASWPDTAPELARTLHAQLSLNDRNWHQLKTDPDRRAAELLAGALAQLLQGGQREDVDALLCQGLRWLRRELKDPGCPHR